MDLGEAVGRFVMPSEQFIVRCSSVEKCVLGPGLKLQQRKLTDNNNVENVQDIAVVCKPGIVAQRKHTYFVEVALRNYTPAPKEDVIGIISKKAGDSYVVDIGTRDRVTLSKLAFEGATKKNKPDLKIGDVVLGRIEDLPPDFPYEITCVNKGDSKALGLGALEKGHLFKVPVFMVRRLHQKIEDENGECMKLLDGLGKVKNAPYEIAIGANGFIWVKSKSMIQNILIAQVIQAAVELPASKYRNLVNAYEQSVEVLRS